MLRVSRQDFLERRQHFGRAALGTRSRRLPVVPGLRVHDRFGIQRLDRILVRVLPGHRRHRVGEGGIERGALGARIGGIALPQGRDQRAVPRRCGGRQFHRPGQRGERRRQGFRRHRRIDVRAQHQGFAPVGHRQLRIRVLRRLERALRFGVVERERPAQPLVEVRLRGRACRAHFQAQGAQVVVQRHCAVGGLHRHHREGPGLGGLREHQRLEQRGTAGGRRRAHAATRVEQRVVGRRRLGRPAHYPGRTAQAGECDGEDGEAGRRSFHGGILERVACEETRPATELGQPAAMAGADP